MGNSRTQGHIPQGVVVNRATGEAVSAEELAAQGLTSGDIKACGGPFECGDVAEDMKRHQGRPADTPALSPEAREALKGRDGLY